MIYSSVAHEFHVNELTIYVNKVSLYWLVDKNIMIIGLQKSKPVCPIGAKISIH